MVENLQGRPTTEIYRDPVTGRWNPERGQLHEDIINDLLVGKVSKKNPRLWIVMGGVGSGKSTLIKSELEPNHPGTVVIDADRLWLRIPEYEELAAEDWKMAGDRTYAEIRYLRDTALAEAAIRRLDIILEAPGDENSAEVVNSLEHDGYAVSVNYVECSSEEARERMCRRANTNPTPEDNLWCSPANPQHPDKYEYQNIDVQTFRKEYERRKRVVC